MTKQHSFAARAAYALSTLLILLPLADIALGFFPLQPSSLRWRIGVIGLSIGALLMPLIGLFIALVTAHLQGHRRFQTVLGALTVVLAIVLLSASLLFTLDTLQLRKEIAEGVRHVYDRAAIKGVISQLFLVSVLMFVGISSLRTTRATRPLPSRPSPRPGPVIPRVDATVGAATRAPVEG